MTVDDSGRLELWSGRRATAFHTVSDAAQAKLLTDAKARELFTPFLAWEVTASRAAAEAGVDLNTMLYRIRTFLAAGLLRVVREVPRKGRAIKVYASEHDAYFIPYEVTPFASLEERLVEHMLVDVRERARLQAKRLDKSVWSGQRLYRNELGEVWTDSARDPESQLDWHAPGKEVSIDFWTDVLLSYEEARALRATLYQALKRFEGRKQPGVLQVASEANDELKEYRLSVAFIPLDEGA